MTIMIALTALLLPLEAVCCAHPEREQIIASAFRWVAETRKVEISELVVQPRDDLPEVSRAARSSGAAVGKASDVVVCTGPLPTRQCRMALGSVHVHVSVVAVEGTRARVRIVHSSYGEGGYGRIHEIELDRVANRWTILSTQVVGGTLSHRLL